MRDPEYALKTGGILAGLVPNREGFSPDVVLKSLAHGPAFWMEATDVSARTLPIDLLKRGADLLRWEVNVARAVVSDFDWFKDWAIEIGTKQVKVFEKMSTMSLGSLTNTANDK